MLEIKVNIWLELDLCLAWDLKITCNIRQLLDISIGNAIEDYKTVDKMARKDKVALG